MDSGLEGANEDQTVDIRILARSIEEPLRQIERWRRRGRGVEPGQGWQGRVRLQRRLRKNGDTGLAVVAGDKHSFWAGLTSADLPPRSYDPVGVEFVTGSISAQGLVEIGERIVKPDHALRALYYTGEHREIPAINYTLLHGVRAALADRCFSAGADRRCFTQAPESRLATAASSRKTFCNGLPRARPSRRNDQLAQPSTTPAVLFTLYERTLPSECVSHPSVVFMRLYRRGLSIRHLAHLCVWRSKRRTAQGVEPGA